MSKIVLEAAKIIQPIVEGFGYTLLDLEYAHTHTGNNLTVTIDIERGITLDDCEKVHRAIDEPLDAIENLFPTNYTLNVSSPGVLRQLKNEKDFKRNLGKPLEIKLFAAEDGQKSFSGTLVSYDETDFTIDCDGTQKTFTLKAAASIMPLVKF